MDTNGSQRVVVNLAAGPEEPEKVLAAFLVATSALERERPTIIFLTGAAVVFALEDHPEPIQLPCAPRLARLTERFALDGGELYVCAISLKARALDKKNLSNNAHAADATDVWKRLEDGGIVFSY